MFFKRRTAYGLSACLVGSEMCIRDSYMQESLSRGLSGVSEPAALAIDPEEKGTKGRKAKRKERTTEALPTAPEAAAAPRGCVWGRSASPGNTPALIHS